MELERYTAAGLGRLVGNGEISPTEVIRYFAEQVDIPVASCLDHSPSFEDCVMGIRTGVSSSAQGPQSR